MGAKIARASAWRSTSMMEESTARLDAWHGESNTSAAESCWSRIDRCRSSPLRAESPEEACAVVDDCHSHMYDVCMSELAFEWDSKKDTANIKKHGVSFEEARTVFYDENAIQFFDPDHSDDEDRFILLGLSLKPRVLVVCHCFRERETVVRLISARKADQEEEQEYWRGRRT